MKKLLLALLLTVALAAPAWALFPVNTPNALRITNVADIEESAQTQVVTSTSAAEVALPEGVYSVWSGTTDAFIKVVPTAGTATNVTATNGYIIRAGMAPVTLAIRAGRKVGYISTGAGTLSFHKAN